METLFTKKDFKYGIIYVTKVLHKFFKQVDYTYTDTKTWGLD